MAQKKLIEIQGLEYDWLACDDEGHVALLSTAGGGYAPQTYLADTDLHGDAIDVLLAMPVGSEVVEAPVLQRGVENTWRDMAKRGIYAFDADFFGGPYRRLGVPTTPKKLEELPSDVLEVVALCRLKLRFRDAAVITREEIEASETG